MVLYVGLPGCHEEGLPHRHADDKDAYNACKYKGENEGTALKWRNRLLERYGVGLTWLNHSAYLGWGVLDKVSKGTQAHACVVYTSEGQVVQKKEEVTVIEVSHTTVNPLLVIRKLLWLE